MNASDRAIVNWEAGDPISPVYAAKLREIQSVFNKLKQLMKPEEIGSWLLTEMEEFENHAPADLISKGETGRTAGRPMKENWRAIHDGSRMGRSHKESQI